MQLALDNLPATYRNRDQQAIQKAAELIFQSNRVFLAGNQISAAFPVYTYYLLSKYKTGLRDISSHTMADDDEIRSAGAGDCAIVFALQRYPNRTMRLIELLHQCGVPMIIFSDSDLFPYEQWAHCIIYARFFHPLAFSPLILIFSLIYEIILRVISLDVERATENVKRFDDYVEQHNVYLKLSYDYLTAMEKTEVENQQKEGEKP